jgi:uncharacterized membrane protein YhaH (DUF805 family)
MMSPAPQGWRTAYVVFFALLAVCLPAANVWIRRSYAGSAPESLKLLAVALVVAGSAAAALLARRLLQPRR